MLPVISGSSIPNAVKLPLVLISTALVYSSQAVQAIDYGNSYLGFGALMFKEFMVGALIAFVGYMIFTLVYLVGQLIDFQLGLSMVSVFDPVSQLQIPITGNLIYYMVCLLFVQSGGLNAFAALILSSYKMLQPGKASLLLNGEVVIFFLDLTTEVFSIGVKYSLPVLGGIIVLDVALGLLVKAVPQANIFVVGIPLKLLVGFLILYISIPTFIDMYNYIFDESYSKMLDLMQGLVLNGR
jgi:flagellar biosynthetic protein FliR